MITLPKSLFEAEDIIALEKKHGKLKEDGDFFLFTNVEINEFLKIIESDPLTNKAGVNDLSVLVRASTIVLTANQYSETPADVGSLLASALAIYAINPQLGRRVVYSIKVPSFKKKR